MSREATCLVLNSEDERWHCACPEAPGEDEEGENALATHMTGVVRMGAVVVWMLMSRRLPTGLMRQRASAAPKRGPTGRVYPGI